MSEQLQTSVPESTRKRPQGLRSHLGKIAATATAALAFFGASEAASSAPVHAAAYADSVSAPRYDGDTVTGSANVNKDCEGTVGCWSYVKIEFRPDRPGVPNWLKKWRYLDGHWARHGQNSVTVPTQDGCGDYRMVVDSYNNIYGEQGSIGISAGIRGVEVGIEKVNNGVDRLHLQSTASAYICKMA